ncbi:Lipase [Grifola frondosa]|uniref:Lipase n=1 Tax=Grifola frondosa TaxID=5627 RepID=A0A1C7M870_GRIFR|nr:Lipase [Grifola frondosa]
MTLIIARRVVSLLAVVVAMTRALPAPTLRERQAITALSSTQISAFKPYTNYASAAYCQPESTIAWNCGVSCQANPTFKPVASGGDGNTNQFWFVGFDPTLGEVIVSHQGTNTQDILSLLEDVDIIQESLAPTLFPGISSSIKVHSGFAGSQSRSAPDWQGNDYGPLTRCRYCTARRHFFPLHLPGVTVRFIGYGLPRVGNQDFADYVDAQSASVTHINNKEDPVPILPGLFLGYHHPSGEVHIQDSGEWASCPGQDNESDQCIVGDVPTIFEGQASDHDGPYDGVEMPGC